MNRIILLGFLLACGITSLFAKDNYTETRTVRAYETISVCCGIDIYLTEGTHSDLKIEVSHEGLLSGLITEVRGNQLSVSYDDKKFKRPRNTKIKIYTSASNLKAIEASSAGGVYSQTSLKAADIRLSATSGGDIKLELTAQRVDCSTSSGSDIVLKGTAQSANLKATSGSDIDLSGMTVQTVDADATSGSDIKVHAVKEINGRASSGADVIYTGNPEKVNKKQSSGGTVKQR